MNSDFLLLKTPSDISIDIATKVKSKRKVSKMTQAELAKRSGVSLGSLKRFEQTGEISLCSLLKIAWILDCLGDFETLFSKQEYESIEEAINGKTR